MLILGAGAFAFPIITNVVETGGDNEPTDTVTAKWTGTILNNGIAGEFPTNYTVGFFVQGAPSFVDRNHTWKGISTSLPLPSYLVGAEYIMIGNDNRDNANLRLDVSVSTWVYVYLLVDNRLGEATAAPNDPPNFTSSMTWLVTNGWVATTNGLNRQSRADWPDELGNDNANDGSINDYYSIYVKIFPAGPFSLFKADNAGRGMYGVVIAAAPIPVAPTNVATIRMDSQTRITWSSATNALSYNIKRSQTPGGPYTLIGNTNSTSTTWTDTGLVNGTTYYYVISSIVVTGESTNSVEVSVTPGAAPANLAAVLGVGQVTLTWDAFGGALSYNVKRSTNSGGPYTVLTSSITDATYVDTQMASGTRYFYLVSANLVAGESANSMEVSALTAPGAPNLTLVTNQSLRIVISWTLPDPVVGGFVVERSPDGSTFAEIATLARSQFSYANTVLQPNTPYYYRVLATNAIGASAYSAVVSATTPAFTGVKVNFQLNTASNAVGYAADLGDVYGDRGNGFVYGWDVLNTANSRQRNHASSPDYRYDTLNHMQKPQPAGSVWEIGVPNGTYEVHLVAGDPGNADSYFRTLVEGALVLDAKPFMGNSTWWAESTNTITVADGRLTVSNDALASNNKICFIDITPTAPVLPAISVSPPSLAVLEGLDAGLKVARSAGTLPVFYQWYAPTGAILDATNSAVNLTNVQVTQAGGYYVVASNAVGVATSATAQLTVNVDDQPPVLVSANCLDGWNIFIYFSEKIKDVQANDFANFTVAADGGAPGWPNSAALQSDGRTVVLNMATPITNTFVVVAAGMQDLSPAGNTQFETSITGRVANLLILDIGAPALAGSTFSCNISNYDVTAGGTDISGTADQGHFALASRTGNFDVRVRVESLTWTHNEARAGLMMRESTNANSRFLYLHVVADSPGANRVTPTMRTATGGSAAGWGQNSNPSGFPNAWLRLVRSNTVFYGYRSSNGVDWIGVGNVTQTWTNTVWVGMATTSHNATNTTLAQYRDFHFVPAPAITSPPANLAAVWGSDANFSVTVAANPSPLYQWFFAGGLIAGATNATLTVTNVTCDKRGLYHVVITNFLGSATSSVGMLTVAEAAPAIIQSPQNLNRPPGSNAVFTVLASPCDLAYQWYFNETTALADQTNATLQLTNLQRTDAGNYTVVASNSLGTATSGVAVLQINAPPVAGTDILTAIANQTSVVAVAKLLANDVDAEGDPITFISVSALSTNGGRVTLAGDQILYTPRPNYTGADRFTYTIGDNWGNSTGIATLSVVASPVRAPNLLAAPVLVDGAWHMWFAGIPGRTYSLYRATNLLNWVAISTNTASAYGLIEFTDPTPPPVQAYYKTGQAP